LISENSNQPNLYPNPNNGNFTIETAEKQTVQIFDINGRIVLTQTISGKTNIDVSSLNEGIYNISFINEELILNKRLVIVR
jgi:hypothetical protein